MRHPKLKGQRLGQVVYNALHGMSACGDEPVECDIEVAQKLFYISDEDLVKLINDYLKEQ